MVDADLTYGSRNGSLFYPRPPAYGVFERLT